MTEDTQVPDVTYALAASPNFVQDGICFAARGSGLYRSDDGGKSWRFAYDTLDLQVPLPTMAVAVSPEFESDGAVFAGVPGGVLRSFDGGQNWQIVHLPSPPPTVSALVISPAYDRDGVLLAGTVEDGVLCSTDRGGHWVAWNFGLLDLNVLCIAISADFGQDETVFVGTDSGIFRSTNGGRAWREVDFPLEYAPVLSLALSPNYARDGVVFAGTESHGLYRSDDRGRAWRRLGEEALAEAVNAVLLPAEYPEKGDVLVALSDRLLLSPDGGQSWSEWHAGGALEAGIASILAPVGLGLGAPLLVGMVEGGVLRL